MGKDEERRGKKGKEERKGNKRKDEEEEAKENEQREKDPLKEESLPALEREDLCTVWTLLLRVVSHTSDAL